MRRLAWGFALLFVSAAGLSITGGFRPEVAEWPVVLGFLVAACGVEILDVWLPHGDVAEMSLPLAFAATLLFGPLWGVMAVIVPRVVAVIVQPRADDAQALLEDVGRRSVAVLWAGVLFGVLGGASHSLNVPGLATLGRVTVAAAVCLLLNAFLVQVGSSLRSDVPLLPLLSGNVRLLGSMTVAQVSVAVLAAATFRGLGGWGLLIVLGLLLVMRQSFALLIEVKSAYRATVEVLARAMEAQSPDRRGHAERVAALANESGRTLGIHGQGLEDLTHAALFHDVGLLGADNDDDRRMGSAFVLRDVSLMQGAIPILRVLDDAGVATESLPESTLVSAYLVAWATEFDDAQRGRPHAEIAARVGARLYTSTRREVDRVLRRLESRERAENVSSVPVAGDML